MPLYSFCHSTCLSFFILVLLFTCPASTWYLLFSLCDITRARILLQSSIFPNSKYLEYIKICGNFDTNFFFLFVTDIRIFVSKFPSILRYFRNYKIKKIDNYNKIPALNITFAVGTEPRNYQLNKPSSTFFTLNL